MSIDIDMDNLIKELQGKLKLKQSSGEDNEQPKDNEDEQSGNACSCLYPFKTEKFSDNGEASFIIYLPQDSLVVDNVPVSITSGLSSCSGKGAGWYYLPTPQPSTGKKWYLRIEESENAISGSVSIDNTDNNTSVRFMPIASISDDEEGTIQYIVGSVFRTKVGDNSGGSGEGGDDIGQITADPPYLTVRRTHYTDTYSLNEIPEIWIKLQGLTCLGYTMIFKHTDIYFEENGAIAGGVRDLYPSFRARPSNRSDYPKNTLKPIVTFRYLLGDESIYNDAPWLYCGSKREFETGSFDIYALVISAEMETYTVSYSKTKYYQIEIIYKEGEYVRAAMPHEGQTGQTTSNYRSVSYTFVILSLEPISINDIHFHDLESDWNSSTIYGDGIHFHGSTYPIAQTNYWKYIYKFYSRRQLFAKKVATITDMNVTQVNTFTFDTENIECAVVFKDWDGTTLKQMTVGFNGTAVPPNNPSRVGYQFAGWDRISMEHIMSDTTITAMYSDLLTVTFIDWDGTVLKTEKVASGQDATPPSNPTREGYTFTGWNGTYTGIIYNKTIQADYE